jgi:hypothetical protein
MRFDWTEGDARSLLGGGEGEGELSDSRDAVEPGIALDDVKDKRTQLGIEITLLRHSPNPNLLLSSSA